MSNNLIIQATAYSVQSARTTQRYGQLARLPLDYNDAIILVRAGLSKIPAGATIVSAHLVFDEWTNITGSRQLRVRTISGTWDSNVTWDTRPATDAEAANLTLSSPQRYDQWSFNVTTKVQAVVSGTRVDRGWQVAADSAMPGTLSLKGSSSVDGGPRLVVVYTTAPPVPDNLHPSDGVVSVAKPVLTFDAVEDITALQVQIDAAMDEVTPDFDSGTVAASGGYLDLTTTAYAGLTAGTSTSWRVRQNTAGGWSDWSEWADFSRTAKAVVTLLNPPASVDDGTPTVQWSSTGTQVAWQARLLNSQGDVLDDSGYTPGTATTWTPSTGLKRNGQTGTVELLVWDDLDRLALPGDPEYVMTTQAITYNLDAGVTPMTTLVASVSTTGAPEVVLTGTRTGIPDQIDVFVNGDRVSRVTGTTVMTGSNLSMTVPVITPGVPTVFRVAPRVAGKTASGGPTATVVPVVKGIWLQDLESPADRVLLRGTDMGDQSQPELSVVHTPLGEVSGQGQVVRRRLVRMRPQSTVRGVLQESPTAATQEALLREWANFDAGHLFRLTYVGFSGVVIIGDLTFGERDNVNQTARREVDVSFAWWGQMDTSA